MIFQIPPFDICFQNFAWFTKAYVLISRPKE